MKSILSERNMVVLLFVLVLVTFSLAQEDSKKKLTRMTVSIMGSSNPVLGQVTAKQPASETISLPVVNP